MRITPPGVGQSNRPDIAARLDAIEVRQQSRGQKHANQIEQQQQLNRTLTSVKRDVDSLLAQFSASGASGLAESSGFAVVRGTVGEQAMTQSDRDVIEQRVVSINQRLLDALKIAS